MNSIKSDDVHDTVLARLSSYRPKGPYSVTIGPPANVADVLSLKQRNDIPESVVEWLARCSFLSAGWTWLYGTQESRGLSTIANQLSDCDQHQIPIGGENTGYTFCVYSSSSGVVRKMWPGVFVADAEDINEFVCHVATSFELFLLMWSQAVLDDHKEWWSDQHFILKHDPLLNSMPGRVAFWDLPK